jgi:hypothetical protein
MIIGVNYSVSVFWFVLPFRPTGGSKDSSTRTQTNFLYADSVCCLPPRTENNKVFRSGRVRVQSAYTLTSISVSLVYFVEFERLTCGRTKEFLLLLRICSAVRVYGMYIVQITRIVIINDHFQAESGWNCSSILTLLRSGHQHVHETYQCRMYSRKLLIMGREDARNT